MALVNAEASSSVVNRVPIFLIANSFNFSRVFIFFPVKIGSFFSCGMVVRFRFNGKFFYFIFLYTDLDSSIIFASYRVIIFSHECIREVHDLSLLLIVLFLYYSFLFSE